MNQSLREILATSSQMEQMSIWKTLIIFYWEETNVCTLVFLGNNLLGGY